MSRSCRRSAPQAPGATPTARTTGADGTASFGRSTSSRLPVAPTPAPADPLRGPRGDGGRRRALRGAATRRATRSGSPSWARARVVAELCDLDGNVLRPLTLREAIGMDHRAAGDRGVEQVEHHGRHPAQRSGLGPRHRLHHRASSWRSSASRARGIELRQAQEQARQDGLNDIETKLKALKMPPPTCKSVATWAHTQTVDVERRHEGRRAPRTGGAGPGAYDVEVTAPRVRRPQRTYTYAPPAAGRPRPSPSRTAGRDVRRPSRRADARPDAPSRDQHDSGLAGLRASTSPASSSSRAANRRERALHRRPTALAARSRRRPSARPKRSQGRRRRLHVTDEHRHRARIPGVELRSRASRRPARPGRRSAPPGADTERARRQGQGVRRRLQRRRRHDPRASCREAGRERDDRDRRARRAPVRRLPACTACCAAAPRRLRPDRPATRSHLDELAELGISTGAASRDDQRRLRRRQARLRRREAHRRARRDPRRAQAARRHHRHRRLRQRIEGILDAARRHGRHRSTAASTPPTRARAAWGRLDGWTSA